jgi:hypothetical protein
MNLTPLELLQAALDSGDVEFMRAAVKYADNPFYTFEPRPDQPDLFDQQTSYVNEQFEGVACCLAGNRAGKTACSTYKTAKFLTETPPPDSETHFWICSETMDICSGVVWKQHLSKFLPQVNVTRWYNAKAGWPSMLELPAWPNGNRWVVSFKSFNQGREALQAAAIGGFYVDEQIDATLLDEINARTSNYSFPGSKLYSLTPLRPDPWLEDIFNSPEKNPGWKFYRMNSELNDRISLDWLATTLEDQRETRRIGVFANFSGQIYKSFCRDHIIKPFPIPDDWSSLAGIDIGWSHNTASVFVYRDKSPKPVYYVHSEYVANQTSIEEHVAAIRGMVPKWTPNGKAPVAKHTTFFADPAAAQERHEFHIRGLFTYNAVKDVLAGIAKVQQLLREKRLFFFETCTETIKEMKNYCWHPNIKNKPLKENDDCADALRYVLMSDSNQLKLPKPPPAQKKNWVEKSLPKRTVDEGNIYNARI